MHLHNTQVSHDHMYIDLLANNRGRMEYVCLNDCGLNSGCMVAL